MGRHTRTWKDAERATAAAVGGIRVGNTGGRAADVLSDDLAIEVKTRAVLPGWLTRAVRQAQEAAGGRLPLVVLSNPLTLLLVSCRPSVQHDLQ